MDREEALEVIENAKATNEAAKTAAIIQNMINPFLTPLTFVKFMGAEGENANFDIYRQQIEQGLTNEERAQQSSQQFEEQRVQGDVNARIRELEYAIADAGRYKTSPEQVAAMQEELAQLKSQL